MSPSINWNDTIKKEARGSNDEDLGEVQDVGDGYVLVQRGIINKEKFCIPQDQAESYDGSVLRFNLSEEEIVNEYTGDSPPTSANEQYSSSSTTTDLENEGTQQQQEEEEETIPLTEEKIDVSKDTQESQSRITKEPITETKTVEVPVTHEEIAIERRPPSGQAEAREPSKSKEDITIPLKKRSECIKNTIC